MITIPTEERHDTANRPLLRPLDVRGVSLRNRVVMAPMTRSFAPGGVLGEGVEDYYGRRAANNVGLIITEGVGIDHPAALGKGSMGEDDMPLLHGDAALDRWRTVVERVHAADGMIFPQLWHQGVMREHFTGPYATAESMRPSGLWGPSDRANTAIPSYLEAVLPPTRPMSDSEIGDVIAAFARSAANARDLGFDGIAIHGAHGYLLDTFFWSETNLRDDEWGGCLSDRARFGVEVVKAIRAVVGDLPIMMRYSQWKQQDYDARLAETPAELEMLLGPLADAGVDIFDASTRHYHHQAFDGSPLSLAGWTKKLTGKVAMAVGGIGLGKDTKNSFVGLSDAVDNLPDVEARIDAGEFDLAGIGRSLLADPEWVLKAIAGEPFKPFNAASVNTLY